MKHIKNFIRKLAYLPSHVVLFIGNIYSKILYKLDPGGSIKFWEELLLNKIENETTNHKFSYKNEIKNIKFYTPNKFSDYRAKTLFSKEKKTIKWIEEYGGNKKVFFDVGANVGVYSIFYGLLYDAPIYAFEPSFKNLDLLKKNILANSLCEKVTIVPCPLSDTINECKFLQTKNEFAAASSKIINDNSLDQKYFKTLSLSLDFLVKKKILPMPDLVKIDVDGNEMLILNSLKDEILNHCKSLLVEVRKETLNTIQKIMEEKEYILKDTEGPNQIWVKHK